LIEGNVLKLIAAIIQVTGPVTIDMQGLESVEATALKIESVDNQKFTISLE